MRLSKKKIYAVSVSAGLVFGMLGGFGSTAAEPFTDVKNDAWYYPYIAYLSENGIVKGMTETEFVPQGTFTVAEAAAVITRYLWLEEAALTRKNAMEILDVAGAETWYAGYIQLMYEAGIMDVTQYGCSVMGRHISIDEPAKLQTPVKRYEFAAFVTRSFELEGTEIRASVGEGLGHEFIYGGAYDESLLESYIPFIADYASIPSEYSYYVLKSYYNGIFNGDDLGNFNPLKNLTRAEMAKVTAVIVNPELRERIDFSSTDSNETVGDGADAPLPDECYYTDVSGNSTLLPAYTDFWLLLEAESVKTFYDEKGVPTVSYTCQTPVSGGYDYRIYHFRRGTDGFDVDLAGAQSAYQTYQNRFEPGDRLVIVLVDGATDEAIDALSLTLNGVDNTVLDECRY